MLTSGFLTESSGERNVANVLGSPDKLPPTLVIHHRRDDCKFTRPEGVEPFIRWSGGKARVAWLDGGANAGDPCQAKAITVSPDSTGVSSLWRQSFASSAYFILVQVSPRHSTMATQPLRLSALALSMVTTPE